MAATLCQVLSVITWPKISGQKKATWLVGEVDMALQLAPSQVTSMRLTVISFSNVIAAVTTI